MVVKRIAKKNSYGEPKELIKKPCIECKHCWLYSVTQSTGAKTYKCRIFSSSYACISEHALYSPNHVCDRFEPQVVTWGNPDSENKVEL